MNCKHVENKIIDYLERNVSGIERTQIEEHVRGCKKCAVIVKEFSSLWNYATSPPDSELSPYFWSRLRAKISEYERKKVFPPGIFENVLRFLKPAAYALLFIFGIVFGFSLGESYLDMRMFRQEIEEPIYIEVFDNLPEGSIGEVYLNYYNER